MLGKAFFALAALAGLSTAANSTTTTVKSTVLIIGRDDFDVKSASLGLDGYGIPWEKVLIPKDGGPLPTLNTSTTHAEYGSIVLIGSLSYDYNGIFKSALTEAQWQTLFGFQAAFKVRMVRLNEYPGPLFGSTPSDPSNPGCCEDTLIQNISFPAASLALVPGSNLKADAGLSMRYLYHYPSKITDTNTTAFAMFGPAGRYKEPTVAAVINKYSGREQMVWFTSFAPEFSLTSSLLQHSYIHWMTRSLFAGKRKLHLSTQVDDLQLATELYYPAGTEFKIRTGDLDHHITWQKDINPRLAKGSDFWLEFGHNGNGNIEGSTRNNKGQGVCNPNNAVEYDSPPDTALEFKKPLGTGTDLWSPSFVKYNWTDKCSEIDEFATWFRKSENLNAFAHVSHTFSHEELNNATYHDASREIHFNQAWLKTTGIDKATRFSPKGIIPPAITGLHNGDAIKAWTDNGIRYVVGDNTRAPLRNTKSRFWPLATNVNDNGAEGIVIVPRYATTIYYNCDKPECLLREWKAIAKRDGTFNDMLDDARAVNVQYLLNLQADPYMFHQANMRATDMPTITVGSQTAKMSVLQAWVETITQELTRLTNWPIRSLKHDDFAKYFLDRMALDTCEPKIDYQYSTSGNGTVITGVVVSAKGNTCSVPVPVTIPGGSAHGALLDHIVMDRVGNEPPIYWVKLSGREVTLKLCSPVKL